MSYSMCWCNGQGRHRWRPGMVRHDVPTCPTDEPTPRVIPPAETGGAS